MRFKMALGWMIYLSEVGVTHVQVPCYCGISQVVAQVKQVTSEVIPNSDDLSQFHYLLKISKFEFYFNINKSCCSLLTSYNSC